MANTVYASSNSGINAYSIQTNLNSFKDMTDRVNQILAELGSTIVTTSPTGNAAITVGNSTITGTFTANTLVSNTFTTNNIIANTATFPGNTSISNTGVLTLQGVQQSNNPKLSVIWFS